MALDGVVVALTTLLAVALLAWPPTPEASAVVLGITAAIIAPLSWPRLYLSLPRLVRDALRGGLGLLVALWLVQMGQALHSWDVAWQWGVVCGSGVGLLALHRWYRRELEALMLRACDGCPELACRGSHCSGFREKMQAMSRLNDELTRRTIAHQGIPPAVLRAAQRQGQLHDPRL